MLLYFLTVLLKTRLYEIMHKYFGNKIQGQLILLFTLNPAKFNPLEHNKLMKIKELTTNTLAYLT